MRVEQKEKKKNSDGSYLCEGEREKKQRTGEERAEGRLESEDIGIAESIEEILTKREG